MLYACVYGQLNACVCGHTRWVPHVLNNYNKAVRVERCTDLIEALAFRQTRKNWITIDEKFFLFEASSAP